MSSLTREIALAALLLSPAAAAQTWIQSPVNGHWYALTSSATFASAAESTAIAWGGHLATIRNSGEATWAAQAFSCTTGNPVWVGLNDSAQEGTWAWLSGEPVSYVNWCTGEPGGGGLVLEDNTAIYCTAQLGGSSCLKDAPGDIWQLRGLVERKFSPGSSCVPQLATGEDFAAGTSSSFQLVGGAAFVDGAVRLTPAASDIDGTVTAVAGTPVGSPDVQVDFDFRTSGGGHIIWLYLADAATVPPDQIAPPIDGPSLYVEFDFYQNGDLGDPNANHVELRYPSSWQSSTQGTYSPTFSMSDGTWHHARLVIANGLASVIVWSASGQPEQALTNIPLPGYTPAAWRLMLRGNTGSCSPCVENWVDNIVWSALDPAQSSVCEITPTSAQSPGVVHVTGYKLDSATSVFVDGAAATFVTQSESLLSLTLLPGEPGFHDLRVEFPGVTIEVPDGVNLWPTLEAETTGVGGTASVDIHNGTAGIAVVAYAAGILPPGVGISLPPIWSSLQLDVTGPYVIVASYGIAPSGELSVTYPIPNNPSLAGSTVYLQSWCQQGFFGPGVTYSFTNAAAVTF
jgi:hypothetical protein